MIETVLGWFMAVFLMSLMAMIGIGMTLAGYELWKDCKNRK